MFLEVQNLSKKFSVDGGLFSVLQNLSIQVQEGEFVCIVGPSGAGKSVFLELIAGFMQPSNGDIIFQGNRIQSPSRERLMLFQQNILFPWLTVEQNIRFVLRNTHIPPKKQDVIIATSLAMVGLADFEKWYVHKLSGGMQQRVSLARALALDPTVLLMDEPFAAIDAQYRKYLQQQLESIWLKKRMTVLFVTHSVSEALLLGDRVILFSARPARIIKDVVCDLPRPRHISDPAILEKRESIEKILADEFAKTKDDTLRLNI